MEKRDATCSCGQLRVTTTGDPFEVSICHCLACQRRTGSAFGVQAGFTADQVEVAGRSSEYSRISDESDRKEHVFHFCPECGSTVFFTEPDEPELVAVMGGTFADQTFPAPTVSGYGLRRQPWVVLPASVVRHDEAWGLLQALYDAGDYAEVADRARPLIAADPGDAELLYNVACSESLAGRKADAIEHLGMAIECLDEFREMASEDSDLDALRDDPAFTQLMAE